MPPKTAALTPPERIVFFLRPNSCAVSGNDFLPRRYHRKLASLSNHATNSPLVLAAGFNPTVAKILAKVPLDFL